jgi:hypothetical protein
MDITYELKTLETPTKTLSWVEAKNADGKVFMSIPTDPANSDYQAYLKSLEETA